MLDVLRPRRLFANVPSVYLTLLLLTLPVLVVAAATWTALLAHRHVDEVLAAIDRSTSTQRSMLALLSAVTDAETGSRGYLLTEDARFLEAYERSVPRVPDLLAQVEGSAGSQWRERTGHLRTLVEARLAHLRDRVAQGKTGSFAEARGVVALGEGKRLMDELRVTVAAMDREQAHLQQQRTAALRSAMDRQAVALWTLLIVLGLGLAGGVREVLRRLHHHEQIVTMCAWSHTIRDGDAWVSIEDYLHRHYDVTISHGISPEQFEIAARAMDTARKRRQPTT